MFEISDFQSRFESLLQPVTGGIVRDYRFFTLPSDQVPWFDTGIDVKAGDCWTSFATGRTELKGTPIWLGPHFQLWFRVGPDGEIFRGTRNSHSFKAEVSGRLYLASYFPGEWASNAGDLGTPPEAYELASGNLSVVMIRWRGSALEGLESLPIQGETREAVATEIERLIAPVLPPQGWNYLWFIGPAEIYRPCDGPRRTPAICCHTRDDVGLLQKDVSLPLRPNTRLRWSWKVDLLPSLVREDTFPTHDYVSIAVEFDNGQDITYFWSAELPEETVFRCPIPTWTERETHVVVRSGSDSLGQWLDEERDVYRDYAMMIGHPVPAGIVRVWLIAVSLFQHREGRCRYADIAFVTDEGVIPVR